MADFQCQLPTTSIVQCCRVRRSSNPHKFKRSILHSCWTQFLEQFTTFPAQLWTKAYRAFAGYWNYIRIFGRDRDALAQWRIVSECLILKRFTTYLLYSLSYTFLANKRVHKRRWQHFAQDFNILLCIWGWIKLMLFCASIYTGWAKKVSLYCIINKSH